MAGLDLTSKKSELPSEDGDSIMTDEIEEAGGEGDVEASLSSSSGSGSSSQPITGACASPTTIHSVPVLNLRPSGPVCEFGDRLGYTYFPKPLPTAQLLNSSHKQSETFWLTVDNDLTYLSFFRDSGPLNVGCLYRFCLHVHELLENPSLRSKRIILFSADDPDKKANASLLVALYAMIVLRWSPADALHPIACLELQPFRDAGYARADFHLSCQDVLFGARKAIDNRLLKLDEFNVQEYEYYEKVENGDWNYLTPDFIAFASPVEVGYENITTGKGQNIPVTQPKISKAFKNVLEYFANNRVKIVVRLNKKLYDEKRFVERGIEHREMYFDDGTNPTLEMCREFIELSERIIRSGGVVAVHCKAGLGRTGTLIGAYLIYKYGFTATEVIGFMRLMRPGTCVGPQQHFLYEHQMTWIKWGAIDRYKADNPQLLLGVERPITPPTDDEQAVTISTPRAVTPLLAANTTVPGQPRKTPGAKTRHAVSAPETVDAINDYVFADQLQMQAEQNRAAARSRSKCSAHETSAIPSPADRMDEEMQLVVDEVLIVPIPHRKSPMEGDLPLASNGLQQIENDAPPLTAYIANSQGIREITPPTLVDGNGTVLNGHPINSMASPSGKLSAASKIGKPRHQRPLTSITDNRQIDKIPTLTFNDTSNNPARSSSAMPRSKGLLNGLGTSIEDNSSSGANITERYNLRAGRSANPLSNNTNTSSPASGLISATALLPNRPNGSNHAASSPSRLPRVTKSRGAVKLGVAGGSVPNAAAAPVTRSTSGGRKGNGGGSVVTAMAVTGLTHVVTGAKQSRNPRRRPSGSGEA